MCENLSTRNCSGTPYCSANEIAVANESIRPEIVDPCFDMVTKISPGVRSSYMPTVMYPSCPAISNLWVIDWRSSGSLRRFLETVLARVEWLSALGSIAINRDCFQPQLPRRDVRLRDFINGRFRRHV